LPLREYVTGDHALPFTICRSPPFYCDAGPVILEPQLLPSLISCACGQTGPSRIELYSTSTSILPSADRTRLCNMTLPIAESISRTQRLYSSSTRRKVRRAKEKLVIRTFDCPWPEEAIELFASTYNQTMRRKGYLRRSSEFFASISRAFSSGPRFRIALAERADQTVGCLMYSIFKGKVTLLYGGWQTWAASYHPSYALVQQAVEDAIDFNCSCIDFGLTTYRPDDGLFAFKRRWGARPEQVYLFRKTVKPLRILASRALRRARKLIHRIPEHKA